MITLGHASTAVTEIYGDASRLTFSQAVIVDRAVCELRNAAERALADGRRRYGNELTELAGQVATLVPLAGRSSGRRRWPTRYCPDCGTHLPPAGHSTECPRT